jgi:hypothetical protein
MAMEVPIYTVAPRTDPSTYFVKKMKTVLEKQGQIEPLQVEWNGHHWIPFEADAHGNDIVKAAMELGWTTILIVEVPRYE